MKYKGILFDFDGTIADTLPLCFFAFREVFRKYDGRELTNAEMLGMFGPSEVGIILQNLPTSADSEAAIKEFYEYYDQEHGRFVVTDDRMALLLEQLHREGYILGIYTGKARKSFDISIQRLGLDQLFTVTITGDDVIKPKPDPEGVIKAIELMGLDRLEVLFVGDSNADIEAGTRAGLDTVAVSWFVGGHNNFVHQPTCFCKEIGEFANWLETR